LLSIGFVFKPRLSREQTWDRRFGELLRFKEKFGHCNVREDDKTNPGLGKWVSYIRRSHRLAKQGRRSRGKRLCDKRILQLKSVGFVFELKEQMSVKQFENGITLLKEFYSKEGHCRVPNFYPSNPTFGLCVEDMRTEYRKHLAGEPCTLDQDVLHELAKMSFLSEEYLYDQKATTPFTLGCRNESQQTTVQREIHNVQHDPNPHQYLVEQNNDQQQLLQTEK